LVVFGGVAFAAEGMLNMLWGNLVLRPILNLIPDRRAALTYVRGDTKKNSSPEWVREDLSKLFDLLAQEKVKPILTRMPLAEAARAHELIGKAAVRGKVVLMCNTA
jgi:NADPH:quinone reductase-like Zn-dependent oxidoreductase